MSRGHRRKHSAEESPSARQLFPYRSYISSPKYAVTTGILKATRIPRSERGKSCRRTLQETFIPPQDHTGEPDVWRIKRTRLFPRGIQSRRSPPSSSLLTHPSQISRTSLRLNFPRNTRTQVMYSRFSTENRPQQRELISCTGTKPQPLNSPGIAFHSGVP